MSTTERVIEVLTKRNIKWRKAIVDVDNNANNYDDDDSGNDKKHDVDNNHHTHDNNYNNQAKNKYKFQTATQIAATANKDNDICLAALSGITCYEDVEKLQSLGQTYILESSLLLSFFISITTIIRIDITIIITIILVIIIITIIIAMINIYHL